jgi:hypothetical protein
MINTVLPSVLGALCAFALLLRPTVAQLNDALLREVRCDDAAFPQMVCDVGLPLASSIDDPLLTAELLVDGQPARAARIHRIADPAVRLNASIVVDFGGLTRGRATLHLAAREAVLDLPGLSAAPLIALGQGGGTIDTTSSVLARAQVLRTLRPSARTRLFDTLCATIDQMAQQKAASRVLVIVAAGVDAGSQRCSAADVIQRAQVAEITVLAIATGSTPEARVLQQLAQATRRAMFHRGL